MRIAHIALWTNKLEELREFYCRYFGGRSNEKYVNLSKGFESYFITFEGDTSLELMRKEEIKGYCSDVHIGLCHISFALQDRDCVVEMTNRLQKDGYEVAGQPRVTGDGFFESVVVDPDGNLIELMAE